MSFSACECVKNIVSSMTEVQIQEKKKNNGDMPVGGRTK